MSGNKWDYVEGVGSYYVTSDAKGVRLRGTHIGMRGYWVFTGHFTPSGEQDRDRPFFLL